MAKLARLNFKFDAELENALRAYSEESGEAMSVIVRQAVRSHIRKHKANA